MLNLDPTIDRIKTLLAEGSDASVTYAALECRLALEQVCYDRLRQAHDYISHEQLRRWQPHQVINTLINEVDASVAMTRTIYISKEPDLPGMKPADHEYVEIGTQIGFDPKKLGELWNALSGLALHVNVPKSKDDAFRRYGDKARIEAKVREVLAELEGIAKSTLSSGGFGVEVSFTCDCGEINKRRSQFLPEGKTVICINPKCMHSYTVRREGDEYHFENRSIAVGCERCESQNFVPHRLLFNMKNGQTITITCGQCGEKSLHQWLPVRLKSPSR